VVTICLEPNFSSYHLWFSPVGTVLPPSPPRPRLSLILFSCFTDCYFLSPSWLWFLTFWLTHFQGCTCTGQRNVNFCGHASFLSSRFEPTIIELDKSKTARLSLRYLPNIMNSAYRLRCKYVLVCAPRNLDSSLQTGQQQNRGWIRDTVRCFSVLWSVPIGRDVLPACCLSSTRVLTPT